MHKNRVLIIEDEQKVAESLYRGLDEAGYLVSIANSGEEGLAQFIEHPFDCVVLDLNLPGRDGLSILTTLRTHKPDLPVLILSARDTVEDRVCGLDAGADDYLIKPFAFSELLARLRTLLRRGNSLNRIEYDLADLSIDLVRRVSYRAGKQINLTAKEFEILELLMRNPHQPLSRQTIAHEIWDVQRATPIDNVIDVHVMRLRKKIDDGCSLKLIHTLRGLGYMISDKHPGAE